MNKRKHCQSTEYCKDDSLDEYDELGGYPEYSEWEDIDKVTDAWYFGIDIGINPVNYYRDEMLNYEFKKYKKYVSERR